MSAKILNGYFPPEHFEEVAKLPPVVEDAVDDNTELWLIRIPSNEVGQADLLDRRLKLKVDVSNGQLGHLSTQQGQEYNIVKQGRVGMLQPYAIIPNGPDPFVVRKIACQVGFVKSLTVAHRHPKDKRSSELEKDTTEIPNEQTSGLVEEGKHSGEQGVQKHSKKKHRRSELSERR